MPTKKTKPVTVKKAAVKAAPVKEHMCECGANCHCHGGMHVIKHLIVWAIIFALGMVCGKMMNCKHNPKMMQNINPVFVNGCLDVQSIECPKMAEEILAADVDGDECISIEEYKTWKHANKPERKGKRGPRK